VEKRWIWPFELLDKLGEGGMGVVYRARYVVDNRHVAVKLLPANIANEMILSRFERELEILNTLRHPHIVRCFGGVCEGNQHFYAMELVEGGTLDRLLEERGKFSWEATVQFAQQMASGLAYAHERGVVHRDVKPGNFLLTPAGKLKLSDFGLATVEAATKITAAGKTMGTFPYMAPEQIRGRPPVSAQTDLYALGCVIFEMLTGRTPFVGDAPAEVMHKHLDDVPPRIGEFAPDCPHSLEQLVRDLLQKDPNDRPDSASIVIQRLNEVSPDLEVVPAKTRAAQALATPTVPRAIPIASKPATPLPKAPSTASGIRTVMDQPAVRRWLIPVLIAALCLSLAWNVRSLGPSGGGTRAEELWVQALRSDQDGLREGAAKSLGELARSSPAAADALISALSDNRPTVRMSAIDGLLAAGPAGRQGLPEVIHLEKHDESEAVRRKAAQAVQMIQGERPGIVAGHWSFAWMLGVLFVAGIVVVFFATRGTQRVSRQSR
jgi:eukaryotic-like serine/threonine-protein kinase